MKTNIRASVFETNSSSTHSITLATPGRGLLETIEPDKNGAISLKGGEFGWEWKRYNDAETKANYCAVWAKTITKDKNGVNLLEKLIYALKEHTGAKIINIDFSLEYGNGWSYIDHYAFDRNILGPVFKNINSLTDFIFNPECWLFTGNDNSDIPDKFYDVTKEKK